MSGQIISLAIERARRLGVMLHTPDDDPDCGTYRSEAALSLMAAIKKIAKDDISGAFRWARNAVAFLEALDGGITLEEDRRRAEARRRRIASAEKAAETRRRNAAAREASAERGAAS